MSKHIEDMKKIDLKGRISYLADTVRLAAANISGNRLRSFLTITIVALGITCLVGSQTAIDCLASLLEGAFGTSAGKITVTSARESSGAGKRKAVPISYADATRFASEFSDGGKIEGNICIYTYVPPATPVTSAAGALGPHTTVLAYEGEYLACNGLAIDTGRAFSPGRPNQASGPAECLAGANVATQICRKTGSKSATGELLNIGGKAFRVAGILKSQSSLLGMLTDNAVYVPLHCAAGSLVSTGRGYSVDIIVPKAEAEGAARRADFLMRNIQHTGAAEKPGFEIIEGSSAAREIERLGGSLSGIALIIGLITLLGAAVALTNIMLICVAERTREVGIRRAVGATRGNIRDGFMAEALLICEAGCLAGTLLGITCGNALGIFLHTDIGIPWDWIALSQLICLATGIAACTLPARRACSLDVVDALRCE